MNESETIVFTHLLKYLPNFGKFDFFDKMKLVEQFQHSQYTILSGSKGEWNIYHFLVDEGFAIERKDEDDYRNFYIELTDLGRKLKTCGSLDRFHRQNKADLANTRYQMVSAKYTFWLTLVIALSGLTASVFYLLEILNHLHLLPFSYG